MTDVLEEIRKLSKRIDTLETKDLDLSGRRVTNAGRALFHSDLLTLGQAKQLLSEPEVQKIIEQQISVIQGGPFGIPVSIGDSNQQGASLLFADAQHVHASGLTTKGDLLGYSTTTARVAVGTDGTPLTALASATPGVSWTSPWKGAHVKTLTGGADTGLFEVALPTLTQCGGTLRYFVRASENDGDADIESGVMSYASFNKGGVYNSAVSYGVQFAQVSSSGSLAVSFDVASGANKVTIRCNASSGLTPTTFDIRFFLDECSPQVVTFL